MPRSRAPKHMQTDFDLGHNRQRDTRSARGYPPHASGSKLSHTPIDAHREREEESLIRDQVRSGGHCGNGADLRTNQSFSFRRIGNYGRRVGSRMVSYPTPLHLIWRYAPTFGLPWDERAFKLRTAKKPVQPPHIISSNSPIPRC